MLETAATEHYQSSTSYPEVKQQSVGVMFRLGNMSDSTLSKRVVTEVTESDILVAVSEI